MLPDSDLPDEASVIVDINRITNTPQVADVSVIAMMVEWVLARFKDELP